mgnify:CR=1 FL=1
MENSVIQQWLQNIASGQEDHQEPHPGGQDRLPARVTGTRFSADWIPEKKAFKVAVQEGTVIVDGDASQYAGATGRGGTLIVKGNAASRCGISMKGIDIVVGGSVGHMSAFMAQKGTLVVCGDAGDALGDSIYEARLYVRGSVKSLGADCVEKEMGPEHLAELAELLERGGCDADPAQFRRYGSARKLYNFNIDNLDAY